MAAPTVTDILGILRTYASMKDPSKLPDSILFSHTSTTLTIYDAYPKSTFHFLVMPRLKLIDETAKLDTLRSLLRCDKGYAKGILEELKKEADQLKLLIEEEMLDRYGFKWGVWMGFHALSSMNHLHLHVLSADLCSEKMKTKKHYNSFHRKLGFFLHLDDVLSWFSADDSYFSTMAKLESKTYQPLLKAPLTCFHCVEEIKNMPLLKEHLQEEWDKLAARAKARAKRREKLAKKARRDTIDLTQSD